MAIPVDLEVRVRESRLSDGRTAYVATVEGLAGVVSQADTREAAVSEVLDLVSNLRERLGWGVTGARTPAVRGWKWVLTDSAGSTSSYASPELAADVPVVPEPAGAGWAA